MRSFNQRVAFGIKLGLQQGHAAQLARLKTPQMVQDFIDAIPANFEPGGDTCFSVAETLKHRRAHCIEAAFVAACAFWMMGEIPYVMDFQAEGDSDHVVALFRRRGLWGAISKSNHVWLRWREPIHRGARELAVSYFSEYTDGRNHTMTAYSNPIDLRRFAPTLWVTAKEPCWTVGAALDDFPHRRILTHAHARELRGCDAIQKRANRLLDYEKSCKRLKKLRKSG